MNPYAAALLAFGLGFLVDVFFARRREKKLFREVRETMDALRSQHTEQRLLRARALVPHWREMARDEDDPAVAAARKMCAADLADALQEPKP